MVPHKPIEVTPPAPKVTPAPTPAPKPVVFHSTPKPTPKPDRLYPEHITKPLHKQTPVPHHPSPTPKYGYKPYYQPKQAVYHPAPVVHPVRVEPVLHELKPRTFPVPKNIGHHAPIPKFGYIPTPAPYKGPPTGHPTPYPRPDVYRPKEDPLLAAKKAANKIGAKATRRKGAYGGYIG